jgi:hypothetical protein
VGEWGSGEVGKCKIEIFGRRKTRKNQPKEKLKKGLIVVH